MTSDDLMMTVSLGWPRITSDIALHAGVLELLLMMTSADLMMTL